MDTSKRNLLTGAFLTGFAGQFLLNSNPTAAYVLLIACVGLTLAEGWLYPHPLKGRGFLALTLGVLGLAYWDEPRGWFFLALSAIMVGTALRHRQTSAETAAAEETEAAPVTEPSDEPLAPPPPQPNYMKGALYGFGAAVAGAVGWFAVTIATGWELGIVAWLVGRFVGRSVRKGAGDRGSRKLQYMAAALGAYGMLFGYFLVFRHYMIEGAVANGVTDPSELFIAIATVVLVFQHPEAIGIFGLIFIATGLYDAWRHAQGEPAQ